MYQIQQLFVSSLFVGWLLCLLVSYNLSLNTSLAVILANAFMVESFLYPLAMEWYGGGAWSVSTEIFFYFLFPFLLPWFLNLNKAALAVMFIAALVLSSIPGFLYQYGLVSFNLSYTFPFLRLPEFVAGMLLGVLTFRFNFRLPVWAGLAILLLTAVYLVYFSPLFIGYTIHNIFILPGILALINLLSFNFKWLGAKALVYLGEISYAFYIVQIPMLITLDHLLKNQKISSKDYLIWLIAFIVNLLAAVLVSEFIEKPFQKKIRARA